MHPGPAMFCPTSLANQINGLLYVDWNDSTATDRTLNPATPTVGASAIITLGAFYSQSPPTITPACTVLWDAPKFTQANQQAFTLEAKATWTVVANGTVRRIVRFSDLASGGAVYHELCYFSSAGVLHYNNQGSNVVVSTPGGLPSNEEIHMAVVVPAGVTPTARLYANGNYIGAGATVGFTPGSAGEVSVGNPSDQGPEKYSVTWLRMSLGELYTGTGTYPIPPNN